MVLDGTRVQAPEAGEAVEQRGRPRTTSAENGEALSLVHVERRAAQHPDARRASRDADSVALPQGLGAKGERHDPMMCPPRAGGTSMHRAPDEMRAM